MHNLFYSDTSKFSGNFQGMLDEVTYKKSIQNMHTIGCKAQCFNSADVSMLDHGCSVSKCPQFYQKIKNKMLPRPYVGSYSGERAHPFLQEKWMI